MKDKNILIVSRRSLHNAPRVIREILALQMEFGIVAIGETNPNIVGVGFQNIFSLRSFGDRIRNRLVKFSAFKQSLKKQFAHFSKMEELIRDGSFDLIIIHEPEFIPAMLDLRKKYGFKLVFNAHEFHPLEFEENEIWMNSFGEFYQDLYRHYLPKVDLMINVCDSIAKKCMDDFKVGSIVIPNAAPFSNIEPYQRESEQIKLIYHGAIIDSRKIENMIEIARLLGENYSLDIMGTLPVGQEEYLERLSILASKVPNVKFLSPVPFSQIIETINRYDIGLYLLEPTNFNNKYSLPNKFFEFIQAKLTLAISPSPEMSNLVSKYDLGVVADDYEPSTLATKIKKLSRTDILNFKRNTIHAAEIECAERYYDFYRDQLYTILETEKI